MIYNAERPNSFDAMIGQQLVVENIRNQSIRGDFFPVFILCGQYGSGKTTMARIIAMAANCKQKDEKGNPCGKCESCQAVLEHSPEGIIEIDGASNNGVDSVRKLLGQASTVGLFDKKIIVIDEAHMLSKSAFNALLITLENPPQHCIFILCTTEKEALPETVVSRAPVYVFGKIPDGLIKDHLLTVAKKNCIGISEDAAGLLARYANGAMRNALQLLEHLSLQKSEGAVIEATDVIQILGLSSLEQRASFLDGCLSRDLNTIVGILRSCELKGVSIRTFIKDVLEMNTDLLLWKAGAEVVGTEFYMGKLKELSSYDETALVAANKMLSAIASTPANLLSVERIAAEVVSVLYLSSVSENRVLPMQTTDSVRKPMASSMEKKPETAVGKDEDTGTGQKAGLEKEEDVDSIMEGFTSIPEDAASPFEEPEMMTKSVTEDAPDTTEDDFNLGFDLFGGGLFGDMVSIPSNKKKSTKKECVDLIGQMAVAGANASISTAELIVKKVVLQEDMVLDAVEDGNKEPEINVEVTESAEISEETKMDESDMAPEWQDSIPVETEGRFGWDEAAAQGIVPEKVEIHLPVPEGKEELDAFYEKQEKESDDLEEEPERTFATRSDLIEANKELQKLLKNPGFRILFNKARYVEKDFHIYLCYESQAMVAAAKMFLVGVKGITAQVDRED